MVLRKKSELLGLLEILFGSIGRMQTDYVPPIVTRV